MDNSVFNKYTGSDERFVIPERFTSVAEGAFAGNKSLKYIDLGNVREIGAFAFQDCTNLETVVMGNTSVIGKGAFEFCRSLSSVTFGSVTEIGEAAFSFCAMLDVPVMPRSLKKIGAAAFSHTSIKNVDLDWLDRIPPYVFSCCTSLGYADISGAEEIGDGAFAECRSMSHVRFGDVERIGAKAFHKCDSLEIASLPDSLQEIGDDAFTNMRPGTIIPRNVRRIGRNCFGPVDRRKSVSIYQSSLYEFRNYFTDLKRGAEEDEEHFYLWESSMDVCILDNTTGTECGFLPLFTDLYPSMRRILINAFRTDNTFDYQAIDAMFAAEMRWNRKCRDRLAVRRLMHPYELSTFFRREYTEYIRRHSDRIARQAVAFGDIDILVFIFDEGLGGSADITELIDYSISVSAAECTAFLLEVRAGSGAYNTSIPDML